MLKTHDIKKLTILFATLVITVSFSFGQTELYYDNDTYTGWRDFVPERVFAVHFSPNPASSLIYINSDLAIINVNIYNYSGHLIFEETDNSKLHQIDISELLPGLYFFKIETKAETFTRRIIK